MIILFALARARALLRIRCLGGRLAEACSAGSRAVATSADGDRGFPTLEPRELPNRAERRVRMFGLLLDWHDASTEAQRAARQLIAAMPGGAAAPASSLRFATAGGEKRSAGAFPLGGANEAARSGAQRIAHARLGEFHQERGATP